MLSEGTIIDFTEQNDLGSVANKLIREGSTVPVWLFEGPMGIGKTTLIKAICAELGVRDVVQSPTFGIVNEYRSREGKIIFHFDCYRLRHEEEAFDIGVEEYLDSGNLCLIEWPERIKSFWPLQYYRIDMDWNESFQRRLYTSIHPSN